MYFLWKRTPHGTIRVSSDGLLGFINRVLIEKSRCCGLSLAGGESASVTLVLSSDNPASDIARVEEHLASIVTPLGFHVKVVWADRGTPEAEWSEALSGAYQSPWTWMVVAATITVGVMAGLKGLFWTLFWGTSAWFFSKVCIFFFLRKRMGFFSPTFRRQ